ncbi:MAG: hypothetical protein JWO73_485 [Candidatus Taylorbacteria bacterium]|nr:hypothetical protein [Candidatus Taylorbacteria bacterium]
MRSKQEVLAYRFPALVERLEEELKISKKEAEELVADLVKFLYLCATNTTKFGLSPSKKIDEAWHNFIVFTKEYAKFCETNFGFFIHHNPFTKETREQDVKNSRPASKIAARVFGKELSDNWNSKGDSYAICTCDGNCGCP